MTPTMTSPIAPRFSGQQFTPYFEGAKKGKKQDRFASASSNLTGPVTTPMAPIPAPVDVAPVATTKPDFNYTKRLMWHV